jgi:hypothetical protein
LGYYGRIFKDNPKDTNENLGNIRIPRQDLRKIILNKLSVGTCLWGYKLIKYDIQSDGINLIFETGEDGNPAYQVFKVHILVGADGIHSTVRNLRDSQYLDIPSRPLTYIGITVIIGLSSARHFLIDKGGFYVLDGAHRLFVMPFRETSNRKDCEFCSTEENRKMICYCRTNQLTMWQLSFSGLSEAEANMVKSLTTEDLITEAKRRTKGWLHPVEILIHETTVSDIWATSLYDRDEMLLRPKYKSNNSKKRKINLIDTIDNNAICDSFLFEENITVLGDACNTHICAFDYHCPLYLI